MPVDLHSHLTKSLINKEGGGAICNQPTIYACVNQNLTQLDPKVAGGKELKS